jgi:hypothetical protein
MGMRRSLGAARHTMLAWHEGEAGRGQGGVVMNDVAARTGWPG